MENNSEHIGQLSVIIPVIGRGENVSSQHDIYASSLKNVNFDVDFVYIVSPKYEYVVPDLRNKTESIKIIQLARDFGDATAIQIGVENSEAPLILILPPHEQISSNELEILFQHTNSNDLITVRRWPRIDSKLNQIQAKLFEKILGFFFGAPTGDTGCAVKLVKREVFNEIQLYGDLHRYLAMLAHQQGFSIEIVNVKQAQADVHNPIHSSKTYFGRALDLVTVIFLTRFNKKPLRFFGSVGTVSIATGGLGLIYLAYERLILDIPAADRPLLVLFSLFIVLGIQLLAIGLVGETFIFTNAKDIKEYTIKKIIN